METTRWIPPKSANPLGNMLEATPSQSSLVLAGRCREWTTGTYKQFAGTLTVVAHSRPQTCTGAAAKAVAGKKIR